MEVKKVCLGFRRKKYCCCSKKWSWQIVKKNAIADIFHLNNMRIEQQLAFIIHLVIDERERNIANNTYLN